MLGQQVGPAGGGRQVAGIAGELVGRQHARAELRTEVQLNEAVRVGPAIRLPFVWGARDEAGPGVIGRGLAVIQEIVGGQGDDADGRRIARVAIIVGKAQQGAYRPLAEIGVHPIVELGVDVDGSVGLDTPSAIEDEMGRRRDRHVLVRPGIAFQRFGRDADAKINLAVLAPIPRCDDPVAVLDDRMGEILFHGLRIGCHRRNRPEQHRRHKQPGRRTEHRRLLSYRV